MRDAYTIDDAGYLRPKRGRDEPIQRIKIMMEEVAALLEEHKPDAAIVEIPSGRPGRGSRAGAGPHLAIYGMAAGAIWAVLAVRMPSQSVHTVDERTWTGRIPKIKRQRQIGYAFPAYAKAAAADSGGDVADAIGLCVWYWTKGPGRRVVA